MPAFDITYESIAYTERTDLNGVALSEQDTTALNNTALNHPHRPAFLVHLMDMHVSEAAEQADAEERRLFVSVRLRIHASDLDSAERLPVPDRFLSILVRAFNTAKRLTIAIDPGQAWEVLDARDAPAEIAARTWLPELAPTR